MNRSLWFEREILRGVIFWICVIDGFDIFCDCDVIWFEFVGGSSSDNDSGCGSD